jgi:hypothetical protein
LESGLGSAFEPTPAVARADTASEHRDRFGRSRSCFCIDIGLAQPTACESCSALLLIESVGILQAPTVNQSARSIAQRHERGSCGGMARDRQRGHAVSVTAVGVRQPGAVVCTSLLHSSCGGCRATGTADIASHAASPVEGRSRPARTSAGSPLRLRGIHARGPECDRRAGRCDVIVSRGKAPVRQRQRARSPGCRSARTLRGSAQCESTRRRGAISVARPVADGLEAAGEPARPELNRK